MALRKLIKISGCSEEPNIFLNAKSVLGLIKGIYNIRFFNEGGAEEEKEIEREIMRN
jgi:hypothetical protein